MIKKNSSFQNLPSQKVSNHSIAEDKQHLRNAILKLVKKLETSIQKNEAEKILRLNLRLSLIQSCNDMTLTRLSNLQEIFKHYCTHIFRTGKYMTFDRLQYQKVHLTMDRFFFFLRDLDLTSMVINQKPTEIIDKNVIITLFKKVSSNSSRLTFQQFVTCIQKLAVIYFDEKQIYFQKKLRLKEEKKKKRQDYERKKRQKQQKLTKQGINDQKKPNQQQQNKEQAEDQQDPKQETIQQIKKSQNDDLIKNMMENQQLEDPNQEVKKIIQKNKQGINQNQSVQRQKKQDRIQYTEDMLLSLTKQQKIQYYYQLMKIDNINDCRAKMGELSLPTFLNKPKSAEGKKKIKKEEQRLEKSLENDIDYSEEKQKQQRIQALKEKLNQKKNKEKSMPIPKPKTDEKILNRQLQRKKKMQQNKQRMNMVKSNKQQSDAILQKKKDLKKPAAAIIDKKKGIDFNDKQINWGIMNVSIEQLKLRQFNPQRYCHQDEEDKIYLEQYGIGNELRVRAGSGMEIREKKSLSIVTNAKKRAAQIQETEKIIQKNLNKISKKIGQNQIVRGKF